MTLIGVSGVAFREGVKENWKKAVRLTPLGGGVKPPSLTKTICENFRTFFPLNIIS